MPDLPDNWTEAFTWSVLYEDGTWLHEVEADGTRHGFKHIDLPRVQSMTLWPCRSGLSSFTVARTGPTWRPIFTRRRTLTVNPLTGQQEGEAVTVTCLGWQRTDTVAGEPRNVKSYAWLFDDGSVLITDDGNAV